MKKCSKTIAVIVCLLMAISCIFTGMMLVSAAAEETNTVTIVSYPKEFTGGIHDTDLRISKTDIGGENVTNLEGATINGKAFKEFVQYNGKTIDPNKINVHYCAKSTFSISFNDKSLIKAGATLELLKGMPVPNADKTTADYTLGESFKVVYTVNGWLKTAPTDSTERTDVKPTGLGAGFGNGESIVFDLKRQGSNMNFTNVQNLSDCGRKVADFILYNGKPVSGQFDVHLYENSFYIYTSRGFKEGDIIEILAGLHFPANQEGTAWKDYLGTGYKVKLANGQWMESADEGSVNELKSLGEITHVEEGATMPATYEFTANFKLETAEKETSDLQNDARYSENFFINGKSVKQINEETEVTDKDGMKIPAVTVSAVGSSIRVTAVASANIVDPSAVIEFKIAKAFVFDTKHVLSEDVVRYYIPAVSFWSNVKPYTIEKTAPVEISSVKFEVIDNGVNGSIDITFKDNIAEKMMLLYSGHPAYLLSNSVPAGQGYAKDEANALASSGATAHILENIVINGKPVGEYWKDLSGAEAKSNRFQMHILGKNVLSIRSAVTNGFGDADNIEITFKNGFTFFSGAYFDKDTTLRYDGTQKAFVPTSVAISADKTKLTVGESTVISYVVDPAFVGVPEFVSSAPEVLKVETSVDEESGLTVVTVTALKNGTAKITANLNGVVSDALNFEVAVQIVGVTLDKTTAELKVGEELQLNAKVDPENAAQVTWESSDASIATVVNGKVVAKKAGTVTITAKAGDKTASCTITVTEKTQGGGSTDTDTETPSGGCNAAFGVSAAVASVALCAGAAVALRRKKQ